MSDILKDFPEPALINAMETNMQGTAIRWGQLIGATFHEDAEGAWLLSDLPLELCNGVIRTHISAENQDEAAEKLIQRFMAYHRPMTWLVCPSTQPADMRQRLHAHGWYVEDAPGMALDLLALDERAAQADGLSIERVSDDAMLRQWIRTMVIGSGMPERALDLVLDIAAKHRFTPIPEVQFYLGSLKGEPVASLTAAPLLAARTMGYRIGVLQSSPMGLNVYRRLGFQPHGTFSMCMWSANEESVG